MADSKTAVAKIEYVKEVLSNGMTVIYAPLHNAPAVHVRVLYHVGSRDEDPNRTGFAHMFEHMMFRGSEHVPPEMHMKMIGDVGGDSNAFTSFDQTTYVNTIPSNHLEMALWLEADRMASFKVSDAIFQTERKVVSEEWRLRTANPPTGTLYQDFLKTAYTAHHYKWAPIGDMDQLRQATSAELQDFFNKYYVPNNACLIIGGDIDVEKTKEWVHKYYGWMPRGADVVRDIPVEPEQTEPRKVVVYRRSLPLPVLLMGYKTADYKSADHDALEALANILGSGRTSRLSKLLVNNDSPKALSATAGNQQLQDVGFFVLNATVLPSGDAEAVETALQAAVDEIITKGVTDEELEKFKSQARQGIVRGRETCTQIATRLGEEEVFGGDAERVNTELDRLNKMTTADIQGVAKKYLQPHRLTVVEYLPDPTGAKSKAEALGSKADETGKAAVVASAKPIVPKEIKFPEAYPTKAPFNASAIAAKFQLGEVGEVNGVKVIVMPDHRLPVANFSLILKGGGDAEVAGKEGVASMTAAMLRRGSEGADFLALSQDLESRSISIEASDGGDTTRFGGSFPTDQLDYAIEKAHLVLNGPTFPEAEFKKLKRQTASGLQRRLSEGPAAAAREVAAALYGNAPQGREATLASVNGITLDDVKAYYKHTYKGDGALLVLSGDIDTAKGLAVAAKLLEGLPKGEAPKADYTLPAPAGKKRIILISNPDAKQSSVRVAMRAYDNKNEDRFAGSVATQVMSAGLDSRMNRYLRADRGLTYGASGVFSAGRHSGQFTASCDTNPATTGAAVEGIFHVLDGMKKEEITDAELSSAKTRVAGMMVMEMQTINQQAGRRVDAILNGYPDDYYEKLPSRIAEVTKDKVKYVVDKYITDDQTVVVVAGPPSVKSQLEQFGEVEVVEMPLKRAGNAPAGPSMIPPGAPAPAAPAPSTMPSKG